MFASITIKMVVHFNELQDLYAYVCVCTVLFYIDLYDLSHYRKFSLSKVFALLSFN